MNSTAGSAAKAPKETQPSVRVAGLLVVASALIGAVAAVLAFAFSDVTHAAETFVWQTLPQSWGATQAPWWWVLAVPTFAGLVVAAAVRLPGHGGHHPLDGLAVTIGPREVGSTLLAAFAALVGGAVLGPEAPLLAIGTAIAFGAARGRLASAAPVLALAGASAAIGVVLGNPLITGVLILELALAGGGAATRRQVVLGRLLPLLAALGSGYLMQVGVGTWTGLSPHGLGVDLPAYATVRLADVLPAVLVAVVTGALVVTASRSAEWLRPRVPSSGRAATGGLALGGLAVGGLALATRAATHQPETMVLFSGQNDLSAVLALTSVATVVAIMLAKAVAYSISLGVGFRGGTVFPPLFIGAAVAALVHTVAPGTALAAMAAAGIAAGAGSALGLPFTALMFGVLLNASAGPAVTVPAAIGATVGVVVATWFDDRRRVDNVTLTNV